MTPRAYLIAAGAALYGPRWQSALAADLGVTDRTMRRWLAGTTALPDAVPDELRALLRARGKTIADLLAA